MSARQAAPALTRRITARDITACIDVYYLAVDDLYGRLDRAPAPRDPQSLARLLEHLLAHDGDRAWLAEEPSATADPNPPAVLGFGAAILRESSWYLALLFVRPAAQRAGLGRQLLVRCFPRGPVVGPEAAAAADDADRYANGGRDRDAHGGPEPRERPSTGGGAPGTLSVCVDSIQPISTGLYAGYGIVPRVPVFTAVGYAAREAFPALPRDVVSTGFESLPHEFDLDAALATIDHATLGYARAADHRYWELERRRGVLFRRAGSGQLLGYGYTQASGRLGPLALLDPLLVPPAIGALLDRETPRGPWMALVPGTNDRAIVALLRAGLRFEGFPALFASTRPVPALERYLPASFALP